MKSVSETEKKFIDAAVRIFLRYGVRKSTMSDIASEAGVSRPTLYASYRSKDEILVAAIRDMTEAALQQSTDAWQASDDLGEKLDAYFEAAIVPAFEMLQTAVDADDLISGHNAAGKAAILEAQMAKRKALIDVLKPHKVKIEKSGQTVSQFANFIVVTSAGFKFSAQNKDDLLDLLASLKTSVLAIAI